MSGAARLMERLAPHRYARIAVAAFVVLMIVSVVFEPQMLQGYALAGLIAAAAPLIIVAMAETPIIIVGNGGIDLSIGPMMSVINVCLILIDAHRGFTSPFVLVPAAIGIGALAGLFNGVLVSVLRIQPIVATFGTYVIAGGLADHLMPSPGGTIPSWLASFSQQIGPVPGALVPLAVAFLGWYALMRSRLWGQIYAVGGDERAAYVAGVAVDRVKFLTYLIGGAFTGLAALALTAEIASADPNIGAPFTLMGIASVALGGTSLVGGAGGVIGTLFGALTIFLINNVITVTHVSVFYTDLAYGAMLVLAVVVNALFSQRRHGVASREVA